MKNVKGFIVPLNKAIVRPHLEYSRGLYKHGGRRKDIDMHGKIQRRATKPIPGLKDISFGERLKECGVTRLESGKYARVGTDQPNELRKTWKGDMWPQSL